MDLLNIIVIVLMFILIGWLIVHTRAEVKRNRATRRELLFMVTLLPLAVFMSLALAKVSWPGQTTDWLFDNIGVSAGYAMCGLLVAWLLSHVYVGVRAYWRNTGSRVLR